MQHVAFLDRPKLARSLRRDVVRQLGQVARHPATVLAAVGNEISAGVVRWHGAARVERFLREVYDDAKQAAPETLLTYVNYPRDGLPRSAVLRRLCVQRVSASRSGAAGLPGAPAARRRRPAAAAG